MDTGRADFASASVNPGVPMASHVVALHVFDTLLLRWPIGLRRGYKLNPADELSDVNVRRIHLEKLAVSRDVVESDVGHIVRFR